MRIADCRSRIGEVSIYTFIATTGQGIARASRDEIGHWHVEHLLEGDDVRCLACDPLDKSVVYAGTQGRGVLRSSDKGKSWNRMGLDGIIVKSLAASPIEPGVIYVGAKPALLYLSRDKGANWEELTSFRRIPWRWLWLTPSESPHRGFVQGIALSPTDPNTIFAGIEAGAVVRSTDAGKSWSRHCGQALRDCHSLIFHATDGKWLYEGGGTGGGVAFSRDAGRNWTKGGAGLDRHYGWAVAADPAQPDICYVSLSPGPMKAHTDGKAEAYIFSSMGGKEWQKLGGGLPQPLNHMPYALLTDPAAPGHLYAGLSNGEVWHTADHGDSWEQMPLNLGAIHRSLVIL